MSSRQVTTIPLSHRVLRALRFGTIAVVLCWLCGCGGMSEKDIKQFAIKRRDDDAAAAPATTSRAPAAAADAAPAKSAAAASNPDAKTKPPVSAARRPAAPPPAAAEAAVTETATDSAVTENGGAFSDTISPSATPLGPADRARRTVENLTRIGKALHAYLQDKKTFPARAIFDPTKKPALSWRVAILPYLGYQDLYSKFELTEPWNSRRNIVLLAHIPAVYQSPERFDERTNYVVPVGGSSLFSRDRGLPPRSVEDGLGNTVFVMEVDDAAAVPWTEPREYDLDLNAPTRNLGALRGNSFYVVWGSGDVGRILTDAPRAHLRAMYTCDAGERFSAGQIDKPLFPPIEITAAALPPGRPPISEAPADHQIANSSPSAATIAMTSLADTYLLHSAAELAVGNERSANDWFYAAALASPPAGAWAERYQWMPALRRPTPNLRFGIGLAYTGPKIAELRPDAASPDRLATTSGARPWTRVAGRFGEELQRALSEHVVRLRGEEPVTGPRRGRGQRRNVSARSTSLLDNATGAWLAPGVHFLAMGRESVLREAARREQVDVLVLVEWQDVDKNWSARITLIDPVRNASLLELPRINSFQISKARTDPLTDNPAATAFQKLTDFLEHQLSSQELPAQIEPRHVLGRLDALANGRSMSPLGALAEMRFYRERGLANDTQLLLAYQTLIGQKPGSALLLGDAAAREEVLSEWLPKPPLPATRAAALDDD